MVQVTQSPFLQALGYAIINSLWQFALLWLIYVAVNTVVKLTPHQRYSAGIIIQIAGFSWFLITFNYYLQQFLKLEEIYFLQQKNLPLSLTTNSSLSFGEKVLAGILQTENFLPYLSIVYLLVLFALCLRWIRAYKVTKTIKTKGLTKIDVHWRLFVKQLACQLGIKREVKIYVSQMVKTPLTIGFFKPLILIPLASLNHLNTYQIEAIILHELAHIKRFDYLFNIFLALIDVTLFFNPFTILISRHIRRERENCCDDWVLQYEYNAASYADALLQIATSQSFSSLVLQASDNKYVLLNRIKRMIEKKENTFFYYRYQIIAFFVMLTVAGSLAVLSAMHNINKIASSPSASPVAIKPTSDLFMSPFLNPDFFWAPDEQFALNDNARGIQNNTVRNFRFYTMPASKDRATAAINTFTQPKLLPAEDKHAINQALKKPKRANKPMEPVGEDFAQGTDISLPVLEIETPPCKQQDLEPEEQFGQIVTQLMEENKLSIDGNKAAANQKELAALKVAIDQLKKVKIQTGLVKQRILNTKENRGTAELMHVPINNVFTSPDMENLKEMTRELELKTEEFRKQAKKWAQGISFYKQNFTAPKIIHQVPAREKAHSFSFEIANEAEIKVVTPPNFFFSPEKIKRQEETPREGVIESIDEENISRKNQDKPKEKARRAGRDRSIEANTKRDNNLLIIRI